jgi:hypothetical protein
VNSNWRRSDRDWDERRGGGNRVFMEDDITNNDNFVLSGIPTVGFALFSVPYKNSRMTFRIQLCSPMLFGIDVSRATKDAKVRQRGVALIP